MQACTHILAGAAIEALARRLLGRRAPGGAARAEGAGPGEGAARTEGAGAGDRARLGLAAVAAILIAGPASHVLLDGLARLTYHPADARTGDPVWVAIHAAYAALTLALGWRLRASALGMGAALLPDLDWVVRALPGPLWTPGALHAALASVPGLSQACGALERLPSLRGEPIAALPELALSIAAIAWLAVPRGTLSDARRPPET